MASSPNKLSIVGLVFFAIAAYATRCHMGYMNDDTFMFLADMSPWLFMAVGAGLGLLAGLFTIHRTFKDRLWLRAIVGTAAGASLPWVAQLYLDLRGNPEAMSKIELFIPGAIAFVLGFIVYAAVDKLAPRPAVDVVAA